jgi:hypothetical protein
MCSGSCRPGSLTLLYFWLIEVRLTLVFLAHLGQDLILIISSVSFKAGSDPDHVFWIIYGSLVIFLAHLRKGQSHISGSFRAGSLSNIWLI